MNRLDSTRFRWIPHLHWGSSSDACVHDREHEEGREGWYLSVCWLGAMVTVQFASLWQERRDMARIMADVANPYCRQPAYCRKNAPTDYLNPDKCLDCLRERSALDGGELSDAKQ